MHNITIAWKLKKLDAKRKRTHFFAHPLPIQISFRKPKTTLTSSHGSAGYLKNRTCKLGPTILSWISKIFLVRCTVPSVTHWMTFDKFFFDNLCTYVWYVNIDVQWNFFQLNLRILLGYLDTIEVTTTNIFWISKRTIFFSSCTFLTTSHCDLSSKLNYIHNIQKR